MNPIILFRPGADNFEEHYKCSKYFSTVTQRSELPRDSIVIGRYSVLPYYKELYVDCLNIHARLINTPKQHSWIANFDWYNDILNYCIPTPQSFDDSNFYAAPNKAYVIKGRTNSRKHWWNKQMFAPTKKEASIIASDLMTDALIGPQGIIYRRYIPLKKLSEGLNGLPFTNEWRFFYLGENLIDYGYYWSNGDCSDKASIPDDVICMVNDWASLVSRHVNFFVLDVAESQYDGWILIEINDAQMSGLSEIPIDHFYENLKRVIDDKFPDQNTWRELLYSEKSEGSNPSSSDLY